MLNPPDVVRSGRDYALCSKDLSNQILSGKVEVLGHVAEETGQGPNSEGGVTRDCEVVLTAFEGGQPEVAACLAGYSIPEIG
jgi:hypothetical protein